VRQHWCMCRVHGWVLGEFMSHRGGLRLQRQRGLRIELVSRVVLLHFIRCELQRLRGVDWHVQQLQR